MVPGKRIPTANTHGTGCTLSSAIAANLAKGFSLADSVARAKAYLSQALADGLDLGQGCGPMNHAFALTGEFAREATSILPHPAVFCPAGCFRPMSPPVACRNGQNGL